MTNCLDTHEHSAGSSPSASYLPGGAGGAKYLAPAYWKRGHTIVSPLEDLATITSEQWRELDRAAVTAGRGHAICPDQELLAAPDELVALTLPELVRLGVLALLAEGSPSSPPGECAKVASPEAKLCCACSTAPWQPTDAITATESGHG
jgi:hypothetical protein